MQEKQSSLYLLLKDLKDRRILEEARRVFYVAVTRARQHLMLSAVVKQNSKGDWTIPSESPLAWLMEHYRAEAAPARGAAEPGRGRNSRWNCWREPPPLPPYARIPTVLDPPLPFAPEAAAYQMTFPSQLAEAEIRAEAAAARRPAQSPGSGGRSSTGAWRPWPEGATYPG